MIQRTALNSVITKGTRLLKTEKKALLSRRETIDLIADRVILNRDVTARVSGPSKKIAAKLTGLEPENVTPNVLRLASDALLEKHPVFKRMANSINSFFASKKYPSLSEIDKGLIKKNKLRFIRAFGKDSHKIRMHKIDPANALKSDELAQQSLANAIEMSNKNTNNLHILPTFPPEYYEAVHSLKQKELEAAFSAKGYTESNKLTPEAQDILKEFKKNYYNKQINVKLPSSDTKVSGLAIAEQRAHTYINMAQKNLKFITLSQ